MNSSYIKFYIFLFLAGVVLFVPFLGSVHLFDWDEINFAECSREMIVSGDYSFLQINFQPFWEKPPLFIWMQVLSMKIFGINEFAARFPNAICGILTLLVLFSIGNKLFDERFGMIWVLVYAGSLLPHFYFKSGIIDPWFNLFIFLGFYYFITFRDFRNNKDLILSAIFFGLSIVTKGPVSILIFILTGSVFFLLEQKKPDIGFKQLLTFSFCLLLTGGSWFIFLFIKGESKTVIEFIQYQIRLFNTEDAGHGGPFYYHLIVLLIGCFPASVFAIVSVRKNKSDTVSQNNFKKWMMVLFCTVLILFSIVKTKIVHYSSLCWFPLTFLGAYSVYKIILKDMLWKKWMTVLTVVIASFIGAVLISPQFIDQYKTGIISSGIIKDSFAVENLNVDVYWSGYEFLSGLFFLTGTLFSVLVLRKRYLILATIILFLITLITVSISSIILIPKIEQYTQGAAIEFYTDKRKEYCKIETTGFKSYAHLFYAAQMPDTGNSIRSRSYYRVSKITSEEIIKSQCPDCTELYRKNGFIFWQKPVK